MKVLEFTKELLEEYENNQQVENINLNQNENDREKTL